MSWGIGRDHLRRLWVIFPILEKDSPMLSKDDVIYRKRSCDAIKVMEKKMKGMRR